MSDPADFPPAAPRLLLVGMSVREVDRRDDLLRCAAACGGDVAWLQMGEPSLAGALSRLADDGARRVVLVGVSLGVLAPAHSWLRRVAAYWWRERAGERPVLDVATRMVDDVDPVAVASAAQQVRAIDGTEPGLTSAAWQDVPAYRRQVLLCRGPRCTAKGAEGAVRGVILAMMAHGLGDEDALLVHTGCQFPCNRAPVISVQPDDVWYGEVDEQAAAEIVESHLLGGDPLSSHVLPRRRGKSPEM